MHHPIPVNVTLMDALSHAERLAYDNPHTEAVVFSRAEGLRLRFDVVLADAGVPEQASQVVTVSRKRPRNSDVVSWGLKDAVEHVLDNLPKGVTLADSVLVERYPQQPYSSNPPGVFAYQFFSTEGLNVGTYIPDTYMGNGVQFQLGFEGRGRPHPGAFADGKVQGPSRDIARFIRGAAVAMLEPGECTAHFRAGWRLAEDFLRDGADPASAASPAIEGEDTHNGFVGRMSEERRLRSTSITVVKPEQARPQLLTAVSEGAHPARRLRP